MNLRVVNIQNIRDTLSATAQVVEDIGHLNESITIIVPDKASLTMEQKIMALLGIDSTFTINVTTINRICKQYVPQEQQSNIIQKDGSAIITYMAISNIQTQLELIGKQNTADIASELSQTISQFKASNISPDDMLYYKHSNALLQTKIRDLGKIMLEYDHIKAGNIDSSDILNIGIMGLEKSATHYIFAGFDDMTAQGYMFVERLTCVAKSVTVLCYQSSKSNSFIYEKEMSKKIESISHILNIPMQSKNYTSDMTGIHRYLADNLFSPKLSKFALETDKHYSTYLARTLDEELDYVFRQVRSLAMSGVSYNEIVVGVFGFDNLADKLEYYIKKYDLNCHIDAPKKFSDTSLFRLVDALLKLKHSPSCETYKAFINLEYCPLIAEEKYTLNQLFSTYEQINIFDKTHNFPQLSGLKLILSQYLHSASTSTFDIVSALKDILSSFDINAKIKYLRDKAESNGDFYNTKIFDQSEKILDSIFTELCSLAPSLDLETFTEFFSKMSNERKIATLPLSLDSVLVCDVNSLFDECNILFLVNCDHSTAPALQNDSSFISDEDISAMSKDITLAPSISHLNRLAKFSLYNYALLFNDRLYISLHSSGADNVSLLSLELNARLLKANALITRATIELSALQGDYAAILPTSRTEAVEMRMRGDINAKFPSISRVLDTLIIDTVKPKIFGTRPLLSASSVISASQLECFLSCPFKHFIKYGLRAKEPLTDELQLLDVGNIMHLIAQNFYQMPHLTIDEIVSKSIQLYLSYDKGIALNSQKNAPILTAIAGEGKRFLTALAYSDSHSNYSNKAVETAINTKFGDYTLRGKIDRVDTTDNYFRIIDYKTGSVNKDILSDLYYGNKIQLFIYANAIAKELNKICGGMFYMPIHNTFVNEDNEKMYSLVGLYDYRGSNVISLDRRIQDGALTSDIFPFRIKKDSTPDSLQYMANNKSHLTPTEITKFLDYSNSVSLQALLEIESGYITPSPASSGTKSSCDYCPYLQVCKVSGNNIPDRIQSDKIDRLTSFIGGKDD